MGDVLLQVIFHTEIENERNIFDLNDVANDICRKLIIRHPHVFGEVNADSVDTVLKNWDAIKKRNQGTGKLYRYAEKRAKGYFLLLCGHKSWAKGQRAQEWILIMQKKL